MQKIFPLEVLDKPEQTTQVKSDSQKPEVKSQVKERPPRRVASQSADFFGRFRPGGGGGNVIQWGNFSNQLFKHNFGVLISKIYVIWLFKGAFSLDFNLKSRFRQMVIDFIPELIAGL